MTTKQYVTKYNLGNLNFANHFNTDLFLQDFSQEFQQRIDRTIAERGHVGLAFEYRIFQVLIGEMQQKFCAISNKKAGGPLRKELWSAFYAKTIIPLREKYFPVEHAEIQAKRERLQMENRKAEIKNQIIENMGERFQTVKANGGEPYKELLKWISQEAEKRVAQEYGKSLE